MKFTHCTKNNGITTDLSCRFDQYRLFYQPALIVILIFKFDAIDVDIFCNYARRAAKRTMFS